MTMAVVGARAAAGAGASGAGTAAASQGARAGASQAGRAGAGATGAPAKAAPAKKAAPASPPESPSPDSGGGGGKERDSGIGKAFGKVKGKGSMSRALVAEFLICMMILGLSPLAKAQGETKASAFMKTGTAMAGVFVILGLISAIGPKSSRTAAAFGGLVTLALLIDQRSVFGKIVEIFNSPGQTEDDPEGALPPDGQEKPPEPPTNPVRPPLDWMPEQDR